MYLADEGIAEIINTNYTNGSLMEFIDSYFIFLLVYICKNVVNRSTWARDNKDSPSPGTQ